MKSTLKSLTFSLLPLLTFASGAHADSMKEITLDGKVLVHEIDLAGSVSKTLYRYEDYETTCSREVPVTVYRYECDTRNVQHCETIPGSQSCSSSPSCRDVSRPVCNSQGCTDHPTRECTTTEHCSTSPSREYCTTTPEQYNCGDRPYTEMRTEEYGCTKTRAIPTGTELVEDLTGHATIRFSGNFQGISGKDLFVVGIGNGVDAVTSMAFVLRHSEDTHFLKLKSTTYRKTSTGTKRAHIQAAYEVEVLPLSEALGMKTIVTDLDADRGGIRLDLTGAKLDEYVTIDLIAKKDQRIGGLIDAGYDHLEGDKVKTEVAGGGGQRAIIPFGMCLKRRPYEFSVTVTRTVSKLITEGLMNPTAVNKVSGSLVSKISKRVRLSGPKHPQCDTK